MQEAAKTAWSGENVAVAVSDILGPYVRKEWNLPVGSYKNPFWRLTRRVSSPREVQKMLSKSLVLSCSLGSPQLVKNLLNAGADPNCDRGQWGPVHSAAYGGNVEVMRYFILYAAKLRHFSCYVQFLNANNLVYAYYTNFKIYRLLWQSKLDYMDFHFIRRS